MSHAGTLKISDVCPNGGHLDRFVDTMVHNMQTRIPGKPAISRNTIIVGLKYLDMELTEEYEKFQITKHDTRRLDSLMNRFVAEGKLIKGRWEQKAFIGVATLRLMTIAWLQGRLGEWHSCLEHHSFEAGLCSGYVSLCSSA